MSAFGHRVSHLGRRFWWAVTARRPSADDRRRVEAILLPGELALFERMSRSDQDHHVRVARRFVTRLGLDAPPRAWEAAALLHDVGKLVCGLGTFGRVVATLVPVGLHGDGRVGRYYRHGWIGAGLLGEVGSDPETVALVGEWPGAPEPAALALRWADDL